MNLPYETIVTDIARTTVGTFVWVSISFHTWRGFPITFPWRLSWLP